MSQCFLSANMEFIMHYISLLSDFFFDIMRKGYALVTQCHFILLY